MNRLLIFSCLLMLILLPGLLFGQKKSQKGMVDSFRPETPIVIDGDVSEWPVDWLLDSKGKYAYNVSNDDDNLYFRIKMMDEQVQNKVGLFGLTVLINPSGKKVGKLGIRFPLGKDQDELKARKQPTGAVTAQDVIEMRKWLINDAEALELLGLAKKPVVSTRKGLMNGIEVIIVADDAGDYLYEGRIPFKAFKIKKSDVKVLGFAVQSGRLQRVATNQTAMPAAGGFGNQAYNPRMRNQYNGPRQQMGYQPYNEMTVSNTMTVGIVLQ